MNKNCKFKIFVDTPAMLGNGKRYKSHAKNEAQKKRRDEGLSGTGHVFISLTDEKGKEDVIGFRAEYAVHGNENVPEADRVDGILKDGTKPVAGNLYDEGGRYYTDEIQYKISKDDYNKALEFVDTFREEKKPYKLLTANCVDFACGVAKAASVKPPMQYFGISSPHATSISIRVSKKYEEVKATLAKAAAKITKVFSAERKVDLPTRKSSTKANMKVLSEQMKKKSSSR